MGYLKGYKHVPAPQPILIRRRHTSAVEVEFGRPPVIMHPRAPKPKPFSIYRTMAKEPDEDRFNLFLSWLSSDRDEAARKYEDMRRRVIIMLECRGCNRGDEIADEAFDRFVKRLPEILETYQGDPVRYLCVIARNVHLEYMR